MGYSKIVEKTASPNRVRIVHQLGAAGERYGEDVTIEGPEGRILVNGEVGDVGTLNCYFTKATTPDGYDVNQSVKFPE